MRFRLEPGRTAGSVELAIALAQVLVGARNADDPAKQTRLPVSSLVSVPLQPVLLFPR